jgi:hypothetical protein
MVSARYFPSCEAANFAGRKKAPRCKRIQNLMKHRAFCDPAFIILRPDTGTKIARLFMCLGKELGVSIITPFTPEFIKFESFRLPLFP